jgi:pimeloyl-ACP methyl ester carboxylesterase
MTTDDELAESLSGGFRSDYAQVNGTRLHFVAGGHGRPLILLPGWPQTWWEYRKVMPSLARQFHVIVVDLRGMGSSDKPPGGYDKKTMANDIHALVRALGYRRVNIAGHDIGSHVAFSFAANHRAVTRKVALLDVPHPDESCYEIPLLPRPGTDINRWWWAFAQLQGLPEQLLAGRARYLMDWLFANFLVDQTSVEERDRAIYARAYDTADAIRAADGWYQAFHQDIADIKTYEKLTAPLLAIASQISYDRLERTLPALATDVRVVKVENTSHWLPEEQPQQVSRLLAEFFA